jgi:amino acid transporter
MLLFTLATTFTSALTITVGLRVIIYLVTCATLPVLRRSPGEAQPGFRVPAGNLVAVIAVLTCMGLLAMRPWAELRQLVIVLAIGILVWAGCAALVRRSSAREAGHHPGGAT